MSNTSLGLQTFGNFDGFCSLLLSLWLVIASNVRSPFRVEPEIGYIVFLAVIIGMSIGGIRFGKKEAKFAGSLALFWTMVLLVGEVGYLLRWY